MSSSFYPLSGKRKMRQKVWTTPSRPSSSERETAEHQSHIFMSREDASSFFFYRLVSLDFRDKK